MPVPGIMEETLEVIQLVPQERIQERIVEEIIDVPVPEVMEKTVEVGEHIPQEVMQSYKSGANRWCAMSKDSGGNSGGDTAHSARMHF